MIQIRELNKAFGEQIIFRDFTLEIKEGEFVVFTGPSGCGKTTLLNMIGGIEPVDDGEVLIDKLNITKTRNLQKFYQKYVAFLFQNFALIERKTVEENLLMIHKHARSGISMSEALERVGMQGKEKQKVYSLSGGEQQRVALARVMMKQCSLILADEPTGSLDRKNALHIMQILNTMSKMGKTVIMVTHDETLIDDNMRRIELNRHKQMVCVQKIKKFGKL